MPDSISSLFDSLQEDPWRREVGFSPDIEEANRKLFSATSNEEAGTALGAWLQRFQPCLFGRLAAKLGLITYCILTEEDLRGSEEAIRDKIQTSRLEWCRAGFNGQGSGFVILVVSPRIALAEPDERMRELACRLASHYLVIDVEPDEIYLDELYLEIPGKPSSTWRWDAGVNYFSAQGDGRWWRDHRVPGGMALSVNSAGHLVKSQVATGALNRLAEVVGAPGTAGDPIEPLDSLEKALSFAMRTIHLASTGISGKATYLLSRDSNSSKCPVDLPAFLQDKNHCEYEGYYHTDYTIPSEYFSPAIARPVDLVPRALDFTYLFRSAPDNPDHLRMGTGRRVRAGRTRSLTEQDRAAKQGLAWMLEVDRAECSLLRAAMKLR